MVVCNEIELIKVHVEWQVALNFLRSEGTVDIRKCQGASQVTTWHPAIICTLVTLPPFLKSHVRMADRLRATRALLAYASKSLRS